MNILWEPQVKNSYVDTGQGAQNAGRPNCSRKKAMLCDLRSSAALFGVSFWTPVKLLKAHATNENCISWTVPGVKLAQDTNKDSTNLFSLMNIPWHTKRKGGRRFASSCVLKVGVACSCSLLIRPGTNWLLHICIDGSCPSRATVLIFQKYENGLMTRLKQSWKCLVQHPRISRIIGKRIASDEGYFENQIL